MAIWKKVLIEKPKAVDLASNPQSDLVLKTNGSTTSWATVTSAATGTVTEVSVGTGLAVSNGTTTPTITLSLDDLMDKTNAVDPSEDELLIIDNSSTMPTVAKRKLISEIRLSTFSIADSVAPTSGSNAISTGGQVYSFVTGLPVSTFTNDSGFTDDQTGAEISTALFAESDTNNLTDALKTKLDGIATGAEVNVQSDWDAGSGDAQILNKPTIPVDLTVDGAGTVHANNYTDTTYSVGDGGLTQKNFTTILKTKLDGIAENATANTGDIGRVSLIADDSNTATVSSGNADFTIAGGSTLSTAVSGTTLTVNQSHFYHQEIHCWYSTSASAYYIPFGPSVVENAGVTDAYNDDTLYIAPYDGKLEKIVVQSAVGVGLPAGSTDIALRVNGTTQTAVNVTIANETTATFTWSVNNGFQAGDRLRIEFDSAIAAKYVSATSIWKFEL